MDFSDLTKKHCIPCESGEGKLPIVKIKEYLALIPGWMLIGDTIQREFKFENFKQAIDYINKVAELAESENHHPDINIFYNKVRLVLSTHAAKGLTENDFVLAAKINLLKLSS